MSRKLKKKEKTSQETIKSGDFEEGVFKIDTGFAALRRDQYDSNSWIVGINGVPSSHININKPEHLDFEYMQWIATVVDQWMHDYVQDKNRFISDKKSKLQNIDNFEKYEKDNKKVKETLKSESKTVKIQTEERKNIRVLHLGGGACSLPRYMVARYPHTHNTVIEVDRKLGYLVRKWFQLPAAPALKIRAEKAETMIANASLDSKDIIIRDVFSGEQTPAELTTQETGQQIKDILSSHGIYILNIGDKSDLKNTRTEAKNLLNIFKNVYIISDTTMIKGKRRGNVIIVASKAGLNLEKLRSQLLHSSFFVASSTATIWDAKKVGEFVGKPR